ncbi:MAG: hypothetical protein JW737_02410 [Acidobacteria bacterium]|nr:hypothetical protein [Acidobacteriota bacterium]
MGEKICEFVESCPFFNTLRLPASAEILKTYYCRNNWDRCSRRKLRLSGEKVPPEMWPNHPTDSQQQGYQKTN